VECLYRLQRATLLGDVAKIEELVFQMRDDHLELAEYLSELASSFQHEEIIRLIERIREKNEQPATKSI
jgi:hypothetical protein